MRLRSFVILTFLLVGCSGSASTTTTTAAPASGPSPACDTEGRALADGYLALEQLRLRDLGAVLQGVDESDPAATAAQLQPFVRSGTLLSAQLGAAAQSTTDAEVGILASDLSAIHAEVAAAVAQIIAALEVNDPAAFEVALSRARSGLQLFQLAGGAERLATWLATSCPELGAQLAVDVAQLGG